MMMTHHCGDHVHVHAKDGGSEDGPVLQVAFQPKPAVQALVHSVLADKPAACLVLTSHCAGSSNVASLCHCLCCRSM
jgi:hypothetical protein